MFSAETNFPDSFKIQTVCPASYPVDPLHLFINKTQVVDGAGLTIPINPHTTRLT